MSFRAEISRASPTAILFVVDQSTSMRDRLQNQKSKSGFLADVLNKTLYTIITTCSKADGVLDVTKTDDAQRIQQRLSELGTYSGDANGIWSPQAQQALNDFQLANGLPRNRILTREAQRRLFVSTAIQVSATNVVTYTGEWALQLYQCLQDNVSDRAVTSITPKRAEALGTTCDFNSIERESAAWRIRAKCTRDNNTWNANIRLLRAGNKLIWSSERGIATYVQCVGTRSR
jgi:peptidoglycan hydrolase-like protein with peptidoglycan-binding domain